jgi:hypothetical protein
MPYTTKTAINKDDKRRELLRGVVEHPAGLPQVVECTCDASGMLVSDRFDVLGMIPACREYTAAGNLWTCDTYYLRDQFDGACYVAPVRHFKPIS